MSASLGVRMRGMQYSPTALFRFWSLSYKATYRVQFIYSNLRVWVGVKKQEKLMS